MLKFALKLSIPAMALMAGLTAHAAQLSTDARTALPRDVQQLVVIDYRVMQNSYTAMSLKERVMPPELKQFDEALTKAGFNEGHDVDQLAFALFRTKPSSDFLDTVGVAQGQFPVSEILANFRKQHVKPTLLRSNKLYPMGKTGMVLCFVDPSTLVFGSNAAVAKALDAHDGISASLLNNTVIMDAMKAVDDQPLWSVLDQKGTQTMMHQIMGEAGSVTDYDSVKKRLQSCWYGMNFQHGVRFDMTIQTGDTFAAATVSSLMSAALTLRKMSASESEKRALADTSIASNSGKLSIHFGASDSDFEGLLRSPLFRGMVR